MENLKDAYRQTEEVYKTARDILVRAKEDVLALKPPLELNGIETMEEIANWLDYAIYSDDHISWCIEKTRQGDDCAEAGVTLWDECAENLRDGNVADKTEITDKGLSSIDSSAEQLAMAAFDLHFDINDDERQILLSGLYSAAKSFIDAMDKA